MQRFVLALFVLSTLFLAAFSRGEGGAPLAVVLATPNGDVRELYSIDVSFDAPMVKLGERGRAARNVLKLEPSLKGTATWLGTRALSFQLDEAPAPGTAIEVTIPKGTKSLDGRALAEDLRWTIEFRRPRLLASSPAPAPNTQAADGTLPELGNFPTDDPILLLFDQAPRADAARAVTLWRWSGEEGLTEPRAEEVALDRYDPKQSELDDLADRLGKESIDRAQVIGLKARHPLDADHIYQVRVANDLPFASSKLGLGDAQHILFRTLGEPGVREVSAGRDYLGFTVGSATHPDTLLKYLKLDPPVRRLNAWETGANNLWVEGRMPAGRSLRVTVPAGMPDLFGRRSKTSFTQLLVVPHDAAWLEIEPSSGAMMPGPDEALEIEAENVEAVAIKGLWLPISDGPVVTSRLAAEDLLLVDAAAQPFLLVDAMDDPDDLEGDGQCRRHDLDLAKADRRAAGPSGRCVAPLSRGERDRALSRRGGAGNASHFDPAAADLARHHRTDGARSRPPLDYRLEERSAGGGRPSFAVGWPRRAGPRADRAALEGRDRSRWPGLDAGGCDPRPHRRAALRALRDEGRSRLPRPLDLRRLESRGAPHHATAGRGALDRSPPLSPGGSRRVEAVAA
ncbi:MAG: hypothetical protein U0527_11535 [Candidatus Eisenbacteria bacterium]